MADYKIKEFYTEKLNIVNYLNYVADGEDIKLNLNFRGNLEKVNGDNDNYYFKVYYDVIAEKQPISLSWVAVIILEFKTVPDISAKELFMDEQINNLLDESLNQFSSNLNGNLPSINEILEKIR